jgi:hypothetical protein
MSERVHPPTGLSDEAATAEYDLIHQAEAEEQKVRQIPVYFGTFERRQMNTDYAYTAASQGQHD